MESTLAQLINHIVELEVENMQLKEIVKRYTASEGQSSEGDTSE